MAARLEDEFSFSDTKKKRRKMREKKKKKHDATEEKEEKWRDAQSSHAPRHPSTEKFKKKKENLTEIDF